MTALTEAKTSAATMQRALKLGIDMALAFARAEADESLEAFGDQRVRGSDATIAGLVVARLRETKSPMALALAQYLSRKLDEAQEVGQKVAELTQAVTDASATWSAEYYRVISLTNLGKSLQQEAGVEVPKKKKRGKVKKKAVRRVQPTAVEPEETSVPEVEAAAPTTEEAGS